MDTKKLRKHFGDHEVPPLLRELAEFARKHDGFFSAGFEVSDFGGKDAAREIVGYYRNGVERFGDEVRKRLALFGVDGDGSTYGLWFNSDKAASEVPVVYLNSEGSDATNVIAGNVAEFVSLLLLDRPDLGMFYGLPRDKQDEPSEFHDELVAWARARGIAVATRPKTLVAKARKANPGFGTWLAQIRAALDADVPRSASPAAAKPQPYSCWLNVGRKPDAVAKSTHAVVTAIRTLLPEFKVTCRGRYGLTDTRPSDFPASGVFPADFAQACELRTTFGRGRAQIICLIVEPPLKGVRATWEASLWLATQPDQDPVMKSVLASFTKAYKKLK
jgi:hypothetical protein